MKSTSARKTAAPVRSARAPRAHGRATRQHLLEIAGQVFAERGFADATTKAIAERAGTPMASINYHFGSRDALYEAVLIEAHSQIVQVDQLLAMTQQPGEPREILRAMLSHLVALSTLKSPPWGFRVMLRELMSPSAMSAALVQKAMLPKAKLVLDLLGRILDLPPTHPAVQRAMVFSVLPSLVMLIAPKQVPEKVLPAMASEPEALVEELMRYVFGGLEAIAKAHRPAGKEVKKAAAAKPGRPDRRTVRVN